jgi:lactose/L-arabinose transport system substrate-binding protein
MTKTFIKRSLGALAFTTVSMLAMSAAHAKQITVWCWDPNFNVAIMKEAGAVYSKTHPDVTFNVVDFAKADVEAKLQTTLASGVTDSLPDIVLIEDYGAQKYLQAFPGAFASMNDVVDYSKFAPYKVKLATVDGKTYSMPFDSGVTGLYYRKDYIEAAGFKPEDMQNLTWEKYIEIGKQVVAKTGHKMSGLDPNDAGLIRIMMQSGGGWYFNEDGKLNITGNAALKAALETEGKLLASGITKPASGWSDWVGTFTSGDVATVVTGVWITGTIKATKDQESKWGVAPIPKLNVPNAVAASNLGGSSWYVLAASPQKAEAIDFLNSVYAKNTDFYQKILGDRGAVGSLLDARKGEAYSAGDSFFGGEKIWQNFAEWLTQVPAVNYGTYTNEVDSAVASQLPAIGKGEPVEKALKAIEAQAMSSMQ